MQREKCLRILFVVLMCALIALGLYAVYQISTTYSKCSCNESTQNTTNQTTVITKTSEVRYGEFLTNLANNIKTKYKTGNKDGEFTTNQYNSSRLGKSSIGFYEISITENLELKMHSGTGYQDESKIADNVVLYYDIHTGNGTLNTLYFITTDGKVHSVNIEANLAGYESLLVKDYDYKNIVDIRELAVFDGDIAMFIDIDGNIYY